MRYTQKDKNENLLKALQDFHSSPGTMDLNEVKRVNRFLNKHMNSVMMYEEAFGTSGNTSVVDTLEVKIEKCQYYIKRAEKFKNRSSKLKTPRDWPRS